MNKADDDEAPVDYADVDAAGSKRGEATSKSHTMVDLLHDSPPGVEAVQDVGALKAGVRADLQRRAEETPDEAPKALDVQLGHPHVGAGLGLQHLESELFGVEVLGEVGGGEDVWGLVYQVPAGLPFLHF